MRAISFLTLFSFLAFTTGSWSQEPEEEVDRIFEQIQEAKGTNLEEGCRQLKDLGPGVVPELREGLKRANPFIRMAAARVLYEHDLKPEAREALSRMITGKSAQSARVAANLMAARTRNLSLLAVFA